MVQTRKQTRLGATPPLSTNPFSNAIQNNPISNPPKRRRKENHPHRPKSNTPESLQQDASSDRSNVSPSEPSQDDEHSDSPASDSSESSVGDQRTDSSVTNSDEPSQDDEHPDSSVVSSDEESQVDEHSASPATASPKSNVGEEHSDSPGVSPAEPSQDDEHSNSSDNSGNDETGQAPLNPTRAHTLENVFRGNLGFLTDVASLITGRDLHHLILAMPVFRNYLRSSNAIRPPVCQDSPPVPMLKHQDPTNYDRLAFQQVALPQPTLCTTPATSVVPLKPCEGHALGYSGLDGVPDHGPDFLVCQHCVLKAWEAYSMFVKSRGVDLCYRCSRLHRMRNAPPGRPPNYPRQCTCVWDDKVWLCRTCRISKSNEDLGLAMHWFQSRPLSAFSAMHCAGQGTHPRDYVDSESRYGESYCPCGLSVQDKIRSYRDDPPGFRPLVRLCIYCLRERFLTESRLD